MLNKKNNEMLTNIEKNTPCGNLLRRYWHPICFSSEIKTVGTTKQIRILGEDIVLIRLSDHSLLLTQQNCPHRGVSLTYSFVEGNNIRCPYHGWLFNRQGQCIEKPFESSKPNSPCKKLISIYSTYEIAGLIFAYLGPDEHKPYFPKWDILVRDDGIRHFEVQEDLQCNWLRMQENAVDVTHTYYLHSKYFERLSQLDTTGFGAPLRKFGFQPFEWGIIKSWSYEGHGTGWGNLLIFPNMLRIMTEMHWRVPIDNKTTRIIWVSFTPNNDSLASNIKKNMYPEIKFQPKRKDTGGKYFMDTFMSQDAMAVETQDATYDNGTELLGRSDKGLVILRKMLKEQINIVENNGDPIANIYDKPVDMIDLRNWMGGYLPMSCPPDPTFVQDKDFDQIFNKLHQEYEIPLSSSILKNCYIHTD